MSSTSSRVCTIYTLDVGTSQKPATQETSGWTNLLAHSLAVDKDNKTREKKLKKNLMNLLLCTIFALVPLAHWLPSFSRYSIQNSFTLQFSLERFSIQLSVPVETYTYALYLERVDEMRYRSSKWKEPTVAKSSHICVQVFPFKRQASGNLMLIGLTSDVSAPNDVAD